MAGKKRKQTRRRRVSRRRGKNPRLQLWGVYAKHGLTRLAYDGRKFAKRAKTKKFGTKALAYECALDLAQKFRRVLKGWTLVVKAL